jgi:hypothetical protein
MIRNMLRLAVLLAVVTAALSASTWALALETGHPADGASERRAAAQEQPADEGQDVRDPVLWSIGGVVIGALAGGVLYFIKRGLGGFPKNPSWQAPISIMRSRDLPDEGDFGDQAPSGEAHAEH